MDNLITLAYVAVRSDVNSGHQFPHAAILFSILPQITPLIVFLVSLLIIFFAKLRCLHTLELFLSFYYTKHTFALFLPSSVVTRGNGRLTPKVVNNIWDEVAAMAGVVNKTPHSSRHGMATHILEKTGGNLKAFQRQLGHADINYTMQYIDILDDEIKKAIDDR